MVMVTIHTRIPAVTNLNKEVPICSVVSITVGLKQTLSNAIGYPLCYQYMNQTAPQCLFIYLHMHQKLLCAVYFPGRVFPHDEWIN
jgi:hypothetical protein